MNIHLQKPIKNVYRVAVKSFTLANSFHNVRNGENTLSWVEYYKPVGGATFSYKRFSIIIPPAYYSAAELCTKINDLINNDTSFSAVHRVDTEDPLFVKLEQDTDRYNITLKLVQASGTKWFSPVTDGSRSLWDFLGFTSNQVIPRADRTFQEEADSIAATLPLAGVYTELSNEGHLLAVKADTDETKIILRSNLPAHIENAGGVYITSNALTTGSTYETRRNEHRDRPGTACQHIGMGTVRGGQVLLGTVQGWYTPLSLPEFYRTGGFRHST